MLTNCEAPGILPFFTLIAPAAGRLSVFARKKGSYRAKAQSRQEFYLCACLPQAGLSVFAR